ncbi:ribosomal subunit interface protein [Rhodoblastus sphagnicola]|uniref:Ribosome hibernation promoting factor n=1 Tax=Rhodoblastus sphagnicola TaxID=333368 RepID=A0A2S6MUH8_9HYPH|nr:ribosome-associated translation inhibitor RaiA [Rhodoblastus sphagnicola]MBB4196971.1 ribosomal subunit interface protein [Rhodoblastus sphagnicola]PPQ26017.1 ribosomal subunit interface protein [Rhodoblastus sphagnicola]
MGLRISGKNINIGEALRTHVSERLKSVTEKYFDGSVTGHVTIEPEGSGYRADCTLHLASGVTIQAEGRAQEVYASFDQTATRIESRMRRYKRKLKDRSASQQREAPAEPVHYTVLSALDETEEAPSESEFKPAIVAESEKVLQQLSVSAAVLELDLTGMPVLAFRHATTGRVNVIYRRTDGNIGWIDPAGSAKASSGA